MTSNAKWWIAALALMALNVARADRNGSLSRVVGAGSRRGPFDPVKAGYAVDKSYKITVDAGGVTSWVSPSGEVMHQHPRIGVWSTGVR